MALVLDTKAKVKAKPKKLKKIAMTCQVCVGHYMTYFRLCNKPDATLHEIDGTEIWLCEDHVELADPAPTP